MLIHNEFVLFHIINSINWYTISFDCTKITKGSILCRCSMLFMSVFWLQNCWGIVNKFNGRKALLGFSRHLYKQSEHSKLLVEAPISFYICIRPWSFRYSFHCSIVGMHSGHLPWGKLVSKQTCTVLLGTSSFVNK